MQRRLTILLFAGIVAAVGFPFLRHSSTAPSAVAFFAIPHEDPTADSLLDEPIQPLPVGLPADSRLVALGRKLFHETRLSADNTISCATCHNIQKGGVDGLVHSKGIGSAEGDVNAPTVFNSDLNFSQFWDGRAATLEAQALFPIQNPKEMGQTIQRAIEKLSAESSYQQEFSTIFGSAPTADYLAQALAAYEQSLHTLDAPFDRYLRGHEDAISDEVKAGYQRFKSYGCVSCHQGMGVGGNMFQKFGVMDDYFAARGNVTATDFGRFNVTGKETDKFVFKVPSLRNVALTAPYFHDGSANTLEDAVSIMGRYQLGRSLTQKEIVSIVAFLNSLTGAQPRE